MPPILSAAIPTPTCVRAGPALVATALALLLAGCPPADRVESVPPVPASATAPAPRALPPAPSVTDSEDAHADDQPLALAPWTAHPPLSAAGAPGVARAEWRRAENRHTCALLALAPGTEPEPAPRRANFSGGWAVAYDLPRRRSAWGVAGTGSPAEGDTFAGWDHHQTWVDGSKADYGPEGGADAGSGGPWLAYLTVPGQGCLYNVWSAQGREHLESLLGRLRFVTGHGAPSAG